ncbi:MAG: DUF3306 domain-containing protein [Burkholderiaceae bacterium]
MANDDPGFLRRWSRRKAAVRGDSSRVEPLPDETGRDETVRDETARNGAARNETVRDETVRDETVRDETVGAGTVRDAAPSPVGIGTAGSAPDARDRELPTMADVAALTPDSDFSRFVGRQVGAGVRNAAMRKLFSDPSFNVMDGLDVYIDDYSKPEPLPATLARRLASARFMNLFGESNDEMASATDETGANAVGLGTQAAAALPDSEADDPSTAGQAVGSEESPATDAPAPADAALTGAAPTGAAPTGAAPTGAAAPAEAAPGDTSPPDRGPVTPLDSTASTEPDPHRRRT